jgi:hypothetical protein
LAIKLVKWLMLLLIKQLAPPSLCSSDVSRGSNKDEGAAASQLS